MRLEFSMEAAMCDLSNDEVFERWQKCNRDNLPQGADYWYDFMSKRAKRGYKDNKDAKDVFNKMDRLK